jgi:hypothetical protein
LYVTNVMIRLNDPSSMKLFVDPFSECSSSLSWVFDS